jgi:geranylgeranyl diphosphate synthase type II
VGGGGSEAVECLSVYGEKIGLAFQIADDILDVEGSPETVGKGTQKDAAQNKNTYPSLLGLEAAKTLQKDLVREAVDVLTPLGRKADPLRGIARYIIERKR